MGSAEEDAKSEASKLELEERDRGEEWGGGYEWVGGGLKRIAYSLDRG